jgi:hypothetical protein
VNITDLPDATSAAPVDGRSAATADMRWNASDTSAGGTPAPGAVAANVQKTSLKVDAPYGYDTNYQWLRGQLDYSPQHPGWRVTYVPAYGTPDRLGGSVAIANPQALSGLTRGDQVEVRGRLSQQWSRGQLTTVYQVTEARRIAGPLQ